MSSPTSILAFVHVPKAGGRTLHSILLKQYGRDRVYSAYTNPPSQALEALQSLSIEERQAYRAISGHIGPDIDLGSLFARPITSVTLLRDPVRRVLSTYFYVLRSKGHPAHAVVSSMSLDEVIRSGVLPLMDNGQTRMLSGVDTEDVGYDQCTPAMLAGAIQNLETRFAFTGTVERFDESLLLLQELLGWPTPFYLRRNVTKGRPRAESIPAETIQLIRRFNELDGELYRRASERLEKRMQAGGARFAARVSLFRALNRNYAHLARAAQIGASFRARLYRRRE